MNVRLKDGQIVTVEGMKEHPHNQGALCPRGAAAAQHNSSEDRLKIPLIRSGNEWKDISWDEALDVIATRLQQLKEKHGAKSLAVSLGMNMILGGAATVGIIRRFLDVYGTPNYLTVDSICYRPRVVANTLTFGKVPIPEPEKAKCIILWVHNPAASSPITASRKIRTGIQNGAKLIVIDPRRTKLAQNADIHVQPRPGTDCALALGLLHVIISEKLYDKEFVEKHTKGFPELVEHVQSFTPEKVADITWVPPDSIVEIARVFALIKPSCVVPGVNSLDQTASGFQTTRAIAILTAITGNLDVPGGASAISRPRLKSLRLPDLLQEKPLGAEEYPLSYSVFGKMIGEGQGMVLPDTVLTGKPYPIKAMIVSGSNMVVSWPNSMKIRKMLQKLDFLVIMDIFMSETAELADIVLPAATFLESTDMLDHFTYVMLRKKLTRFAESLPDGEFWLKLAHKMGYNEYFPYKDMDDVLQSMLEPTGLSFEQLYCESPQGVQYGEVKYGQYRDKGFRTPSGKVELYSETMRELGYDPLPTYCEPVESPVSTPDSARDYPLILTTGARSTGNLHSQLRNVPELRTITPEPLAEINPSTAQNYMIVEGETIILENSRGSIQIKAKITEDIIPNVVSIPHGWAQANANLLTQEADGDPISGIPSLKSGLCRIRKINSKVT